MCKTRFKLPWRRQARLNNLNTSEIMCSSSTETITVSQENLTRDLENLIAALGKVDLYHYRAILARQLGNRLNTKSQYSAMSTRLNNIYASEGVTNVWDIFILVQQLIIDRYIYAPTYIEVASRTPDIYVLIANKLPILTCVIEIAIYEMLSSNDILDEIPLTLLTDLVLDKFYDFDTKERIIRYLKTMSITSYARTGSYEVTRLDLSSTSEHVRIKNDNVCNGDFGVSVNRTDKIELLGDMDICIDKSLKGYEYTDIPLVVKNPVKHGVTIANFEKVIRKLLIIRSNNLKQYNRRINTIISFDFGDVKLSSRHVSKSYKIMESRLLFQVYKLEYNVEKISDDILKNMITYENESEFLNEIKINIMICNWNRCSKLVDTTSACYLPSNGHGTLVMDDAMMLDTLILAGYGATFRGDKIYLICDTSTNMYYKEVTHVHKKIWHAVETKYIDITGFSAWPRECMVAGSTTMDKIR